ncbi:MAG: ATP-binding protein [Anaerolineae bacterium]|nr:ATP-binding protein [Anaerolineae bacterium]
MERISLTSLGQLTKVDINFGDITVLVGPQASGKSIFLQLVKLVLDHNHIIETLQRYGFDWMAEPDNFLTLYFGTGMGGIWNQDTQVQVDNTQFNFQNILSPQSTSQTESLFLIPAQRVMVLRNSWPRPFTDYETGDPYVVKLFSEHLRQLMEVEFTSSKGAIFPQVGRMDKNLQEIIERSIFDKAKVRLDTSGMRKRIILDIGEHQLPFMIWSAGQREFIPLLLGIYWLMPPSERAKRENIHWVVVEEPEMGLHPQAISTLLVTCLELVHRGYKLVISTHSPQILEMIWAIQTLAQTQATPTKLLEIFDLPKNEFFSAIADNILHHKSFKTYYFAHQEKGILTEDISTLDPESLNEAISDWGGLTTFSTKVSEIISEAIWTQL